MKNFQEGQWVLTPDGEGQVVHRSNPSKWTVDINGMWNDYLEEDIEIEPAWRQASRKQAEDTRIKQPAPTPCLLSYARVYASSPTDMDAFGFVFGKEGEL